MTPTTRTEYDAKLDAIERIERQVRRYDGAQAADLIVYGRVPIKDLAWTELEPEEIASAAMGGVTEGYRKVYGSEMPAGSQWQDRTGDILEVLPDGKGYTWVRIGETWHTSTVLCFPLDCFLSIRPLTLRWSQIESLAGGEGRR